MSPLRLSGTLGARSDSMGAGGCSGSETCCVIWIFQLAVRHVEYDRIQVPISRHAPFGRLHAVRVIWLFRSLVLSTGCDASSDWLRADDRSGSGASARSDWLRADDQVSGSQHAR